MEMRPIFVLLEEIATEGGEDMSMVIGGDV